MNFYIWNLAISLYLTGLIWTIQMVHYPSFRYVAEDKFAAFNQMHQQGMTSIVGPIMIAELAISGLLYLQSWQDLRLLSLFVIVLLTWLSTFLVSVPLHTQLLNGGYNIAVIEKLIVTNWPRTVLWTLKAGLMILWVGRYAKIAS